MIPTENINESKTKNSTISKHYDNSNGSLYNFATQHNLNAYEFDVIKRIVRCRKKGEFNTDIRKTIEVLELYLQEQGDGKIVTKPNLNEIESSLNLISEKYKTKFYYEKLIENLTSLVNETPNDMELGKVVRKLIENVNSVSE